jgi:uncharacterized protein (TIGR03435 family)
LQPFEIAAPDWLHDSRFDFQARVPAATAKATFKTMLQNLLTERFKLATHRESKEMVVYELSVGRNGPKFQESVPATPQKEAPLSGAMARDKDGFPILPAGASMALVPGHARIRSDNQPISWFIQMLSGQLQGPVVDATGLSGKYDFLLSWAFDDNASGSADGSVSASAPDPYRPALISAVQSQLGLKLDQKKGRVEVLVVDHIEKQPTAN